MLPGNAWLMLRGAVSVPAEVMVPAVWVIGALVAFSVRYTKGGDVVADRHAAVRRQP